MSGIREYLREQRKRRKESPRKPLVVGISALPSILLVALAVTFALHPRNDHEHCRNGAIIVAVCVIWLGTDMTSSASNRGTDWRYSEAPIP